LTYSLRTYARKELRSSSVTSKFGDEGYFGYGTIAVAVRYVLPDDEKEGRLKAAIINAGWSFCSPKDIFRASRGRLGAVRRLISRQAIAYCHSSDLLPKKEIKGLAEIFLGTALEKYPPPWYAKASSPMFVKRVCLCGPKRAKAYTR
jgi:hypothetical protein